MEENKYKLQIQSNHIKNINQPFGNGIHAEFACSTINYYNKSYYLTIFYLPTQYILELSYVPNKRGARYSFVNVELEDIDNYKTSPDIFYKYTNFLIDNFIEDLKEKNGNI